MSKTIEDSILKINKEDDRIELTCMIDEGQVTQKLPDSVKSRINGKDYFLNEIINKYESAKENFRNHNADQYDNINKNTYKVGEWLRHGASVGIGFLTGAVTAAIMHFGVFGAPLDIYTLPQASQDIILNVDTVSYMAGGAAGGILSMGFFPTPKNAARSIAAWHESKIDNRLRKEISLYEHKLIEIVKTYAPA